MRGLKTELHETVQHIQDPKALKEQIKKMYQKHVTEAVASRAVEPDIAAEYARQREYLEKSVESLKRKLAKNTEIARTDSTRLMRENVALIKEINELRREIKGFKLAKGIGEKGGGRGGGAGGGGAPASLGEALDELSVHKRRVAALTERLQELDPAGEMGAIDASREQLPPYELGGVAR